MPQIPTLDASGYPGFDLSTWYGLYAPAGTPGRLSLQNSSEALAHALQDLQVKARLEPLGAEPYPVSQATPAALRTYLKSEIDRWIEDPASCLGPAKLTRPPQQQSQTIAPP